MQCSHQVRPHVCAQYARVNPDPDPSIQPQRRHDRQYVVGISHLQLCLRLLAYFTSLIHHQNYHDDAIPGGEE